MSNIIDSAFKNIDPNNKKFVEKNTDIVEEIYKIFEEKGLSQQDLAELLDKHPSEISKYLSGVHNLTLRSITKMEIALGSDIIMSYSKAREKYRKAKFFALKKDARKNEGDISNVGKVKVEFRDHIGEERSIKAS
jgi:transcriptional regulator with XRE-family HTH domain